MGDLEILVPMAGVIDKDAELARLDKEIDKISKELERLATKLSNPKFVDKAPADVVKKEKDREEENKAAHTKLTEQKAKIASL